MSVEVMIEGRQRAHDANHDRHRVLVTAKAGINRVICSFSIVWCVIVFGISELAVGRQLAVKQQVAYGDKVRAFGQLLDRVAAVEQFAFVAVKIGNFRRAIGGGREAPIVREAACFLIKISNVDDVRADRAPQD